MTTDWAAIEARAYGEDTPSGQRGRMTEGDQVNTLKVYCRDIRTGDVIDGSLVVAAVTTDGGIATVTVADGRSFTVRGDHTYQVRRPAVTA